MANKSWILGSNNRKKAMEMEAILSRLGVSLATPKDAGLTLDVDEWGTDFAQNAALKALHFAAAYDGPAIADDSGLSVVGLDGRPGVRSARFAGEDATDDENNLKLQAELGARPNVSRVAAYHSVIALAAVEGWDDPLIQRLRAAERPEALTRFDALAPKGGFLLDAALTQEVIGRPQTMELWLFEGRWVGEIASEARGEGGFGYDPWFRLDDGRHVAELPDEEKNRLSHRAQALGRLALALSQ